MKNQLNILKDLSKYRFPSEMDSYFKEIIELLKRDRRALEVSRLRKGWFKEFQEEFVPAYVFSLSPYFPADAKVKIIIGNQNYDFVVLRPDGVEEKYEVSSYIDGEQEVEIAKALNEVGVWSSRLRSYENLEDRMATYMERTKSNIKNKSMKDYTGISLIFSVTTFQFSPVLNTRPEFSIESLVNFIQMTPFRAKHIYLIVEDGKDSHTVGSKILKIK
ncbi:hypothetical protein [Exiguobacterium sp. s28]|uniref:hypothetical protein n=1 Tax=Exiguobacterium sp. s28 TaxID=2751238 RepID=UPI001BEC63A2|nr:hypothetical protein [Exiguobacterium sp. s28]